MKKLLLILLCMSLFLFVGCNDEPDEPETPETPDVVEGPSLPPYRVSA